MPSVLDKAVKINRPVARRTNVEESASILIGELVGGNAHKQAFTKTFDVAIVGGGPSGAYLAYCLARSGVEAVVIDRSRQGEKPSAGNISSTALERFPILKAVPGPIEFGRSMDIVSSEGRRVTLEDTSRRFVAGMSRTVLDSFLLEAAVRRGARAMRMSVDQITHESGGWELRSGRERIKARILVGADGVGSMVRKTVSSPHRLEDLAMCTGYLATGMSQPNVLKFTENQSIVLWSNGNKARLCIGVSDCGGDGRRMRSALEEFIAVDCAGAKLLSPWTWLRPSARSAMVFKQPCAGKNWLLTGDAAGHVHPITGEGILYALWSAELAAEAICDGDPRVFDTLWREHYGEELARAATVAGWFFDQRVTRAAVTMASRSSAFSQLLYSMFNSDCSMRSLPLEFLKRAPRIARESFSRRAA